MTDYCSVDPESVNNISQKFKNFYNSKSMPINTSSVMDFG